MATTKCPSCGQRVGVDGSGKIHLHQRPDKHGTCPGSGQPAR